MEPVEAAAKARIRENNLLDRIEVPITSHVAGEPTFFDGHDETRATQRATSERGKDEPGFASS
jgi:hypothetical protein